MSLRLLLIPILLLAISILHAQAPQMPAFEVASVKLNPGCTRSGLGGSIASPASLSLPCVTLRTVIRLTYGRRLSAQPPARVPEVIGGPAWLDTDYYDIAGKASGGATREQTELMLRALLEDRFQLKVHIETGSRPIYALTVIPGKLKLRSATATCTRFDPDLPGPHENSSRYCGSSSTRTEPARAVYDAWSVTMADLAAHLSAGDADRPVLDRTGLTGIFDVHLEYLARRIQPADADAALDTAQPIATALQQQLGLKLSSATGNVDVIVIDRIERPSAN